MFLCSCLTALACLMQKKPKLQSKHMSDRYMCIQAVKCNCRHAYIQYRSELLLLVSIGLPYGQPQ